MNYALETLTKLKVRVGEMPTISLSSSIGRAFKTRYGVQISLLAFGKRRMDVFSIDT